MHCCVLAGGGFFIGDFGAIRLAAANNDSLAATVRPLVFRTATGGLISPRRRLLPGEVAFTALPLGGLRIRSGSAGTLRIFDYSGRLVRQLVIDAPVHFRDGRMSGSARFCGPCLLVWESGGRTDCPADRDPAIIFAMCRSIIAPAIK